MTPVCVMLRNDVSVAADTEMWRSTSQKCDQEVFTVTEREEWWDLCTRFHPAREKSQSQRCLHHVLRWWSMRLHCNHTEFHFPTPSSTLRAPGNTRNDLLHLLSAQKSSATAEVLHWTEPKGDFSFGFPLSGELYKAHCCCFLGGFGVFWFFLTVE